MPKHKPIKFEALDQGVVKQINKIISENKTAKSILNATLAIMATGGIITLGALAPGLLTEINKISRRKRRRGMEKYREIWKNFNLLKKKGDLEFIKDVFNLKPFVKIFLVDEMTDGKTLYHFRNLLKQVSTK